MDITDEIKQLAKTALNDTSEHFSKIDETAQFNTEKVLKAFQRYKVSETDFAATTGYGYNDRGREKLDLIYADIFGMSSALVRHGFVSGTHAITTALFAMLKPGSTLISVSGLPYDTLLGVIGIKHSYKGSLKEYGIKYRQVELNEDGSPNIIAICEAVRNEKSGAVLIQRSGGYSGRRALTVSEIGEICKAVKDANKDFYVFTDNCYGEFTETIEPGDVGVDLIAGSLIKNPGGGLAPTGGYVAGKPDLVEAAAARYAAPGIGFETGATLGINRLIFQGLYMAPHIVAQAIKSVVFAARLFELMGFKTYPGYLDKRSDIVQVIELGSPELVKRFCLAIQNASPIDSYVTPVESEMPGYESPVIMAAGTFIQGASIELTADAPMRKPYNVYLQGGLTFESSKYSIMLAATNLIVS